MSNAMMIAMTRKQEDGYDSFNENAYSVQKIPVLVRGKVYIYQPKKEVK